MDTADMLRGANTPSRIAAVFMCLLLSGCGILRPHPREPASPPTQERKRPPFFVEARPCCRLVFRKRGSKPSRLLLLRVRIEAEEDSIRLADDGIRLCLPGGHRATVFDPPRAAALLARTRLRTWSSRGSNVPRPNGCRLACNLDGSGIHKQIIRHLLKPGTSTPGHPLVGYVVADTGRPLASLRGAKLTVRATRLPDALPVREIFVFTERDNERNNRSRRLLPAPAASLTRY